MKFYIHSDDPGFTIVVYGDDEDTRTVESITELFIESLKEKYPDLVNTIDFQSLQIRNESRTLEKSDKVCSCVKHMDDLYVSWETKVRESSLETGETGAKNEVEEQVHSTEELLLLANSLFKKFQLRYAIAVYQDILGRDPLHKEALLGLGDCYMKADRYHEAKQCLEKVDSCIDTGYRLGECHIKLGNADKAIEVWIEYVKTARARGGMNTCHKHNVQVLLARAYKLKDKKDMAIAVLQGVLRENMKHTRALIEYASLIGDLSPEHKEESVTIVLQALANNRENKYVKEKFAEVICQQDGLKVLEKVAGSAWSDVNAVVFMATSLRDAGVISEALKLMEHGYRLDPRNAQTLLTYVHMMELVEGHSKAVHMIKHYIETYPEESVGEFKCGMLQEVLDPITDQTCIYLHGPLSPIGIPSVNIRSQTEPYDEDTRYLLALLFTLVKVLYIKGALAYIQPVVTLLDPLLENQDLHQTNIRNEAAFYTCISQITRQCSPFIPYRSSQFIYFVGDSHCIPPAWHNVKYQNETRTVHPILSTGTKIWHLRDKGTFYPKHNFYSSISAIPPKADVIFCFGEIDCREALLLCVEKGRYDTLEVAISAVIDIYIKLLLKLHQDQQWKIHVHPVMPVLDITRSIVLQFNLQLSEKLQYITELHWLEFVEELLEEREGEIKFKSEYDLDGTHAHPSYLKFLESSFNHEQ